MSPTIIALYLINYGWAWTFRAKGDLDLPRDRLSNAVWLGGTTALFFLARFLVKPLPAGVPQDAGDHLVIAAQVMPFALVFSIASIAFFCWPNFSVHVARLTRALRLAPPPDPE